MKLQGILGGGTGKLGESVFTNNAGRTIVRQYNPHVRNPRTARQQNSRERFKMASELAKEFAQALKIGMPRIGALTSRNRFTSSVIPVSAGVINMTGSGLEVDYSEVVLAKGGMPNLLNVSVAPNQGETGLVVTMAAPYKPEEAGYVPPMPGKAGIVLVVRNGNEDYLLVKQKIAGNAATVEFDNIDMTLFGQGDCYVFAKWVPDAYNDINAETLPWKFPSDQSASVHVSL